MKQNHIEIETPTKLSQLDSILIRLANCINDLQDRIGVLEDEIKRCEKKYPDPRNRNPYDASRGGLKR